MSGRARKAADPLAAVAVALERGLPVRLDLPRRGRLHLDRPLPFLAVHVNRRSAPAARAATMANAAYLLAGNLSDAAAIVRLVGEVERELRHVRRRHLRRVGADEGFALRFGRGHAHLSRTPRTRARSMPAKAAVQATSAT